MKRISVSMILLAAGMFILWCSRPDEQSALPTNPLPAHGPPNATSARYLRSGQWRADARTLVAAIDFLLAPEPVGTNKIHLPA
jgi:hypothetical protein